MPRYRRLEEANRLIPEVDRLLRLAISSREQANEAETVLNNHRRNLILAGGAFVNINKWHALRDQRENAVTTLKQAVQDIQYTGAEIKDLDTGLIDFLCLYEGDEVCLCWKLGEDEIRYWHSTTEGFAGRREIDEHFRQYHRGDAVS